MIKDYDTFVSEGRMGKLIDAARNDKVRKEDDINRLNPKDFVDYLNNNYRISHSDYAETFASYSSEDNRIRCRVCADNGNLFYILFFDFCGTNRGVIYVSKEFLDFFPSCYDALSKKFIVKDHNAPRFECYSFMQSESDRVDNTLFIDVFETIQKSLKEENRIVYIEEGRMGKLIDAAKTGKMRDEDIDPNVTHILKQLDKMLFLPADGLDVLVSQKSESLTPKEISVLVSQLPEGYHLMTKSEWDSFRYIKKSGYEISTGDTWFDELAMVRIKGDSKDMKIYTNGYYFIIPDDKSFVELHNNGNCIYYRTACGLYEKNGEQVLSNALKMQDKLNWLIADDNDEIYYIKIVKEK